MVGIHFILSRAYIVRVKIITLENCGGLFATIKLVKETALDMGITLEFEHVVVHTQEDAREHRHIGNPTVQIEGYDIDLKHELYSGLASPEEDMGYRRHLQKN